MWQDGDNDFGVKVQYTVCVMVVWQLGSGARWPRGTAHNVNGRTAGWCRGCGCDSWRFGSMIAVAFCFKIVWWCFGSVGCRFPVLLPNIYMIIYVYIYVYIYIHTHEYIYIYQIAQHNDITTVP